MTETGRQYGPAVGEPPVLVDPRRWGALVGVAGGVVFAFGYAQPLGTAMSVGSKVLAVALALFDVVALYLRPASLGPFLEPTHRALMVYGGCVVGELLGIALGTRLLVGMGREDLRPALIAGVVGLHFIPFAWAFGERMFHRMGLSLLGLGAAGLISGYLGLAHAAEGAAVASGLVMLAFIARRARGPEIST